jgi:hypothetical protein
MRRSRYWLLFSAIVVATLGFHAPTQETASRLARSAADSTAVLVASGPGDLATIGLRPEVRQDGTDRLPFHAAYLPAVLAAVLAALSWSVAVRTVLRPATVLANSAGSRAPPAL